MSIYKPSPADDDQISLTLMGFGAYPIHRSIYITTQAVFTAIFTGRADEKSSVGRWRKLGVYLCLLEVIAPRTRTRMQRQLEPKLELVSGRIDTFSNFGDGSSGALIDRSKAAYAFILGRSMRSDPLPRTESCLTRQL